MNSSLYMDAGSSYSSFYDTQYMYQQHPALPSPPTSPHFSWQVTTVDEDAHTHTYNDKIPSGKARRTQIPAETMSSLMTGPDPTDGKYVCLYGGCMRRFGRKYNIQSHIQTHLADRPFRCNVCAAGFVRRHDLVRHARIHGTGKDFVCGCGKGFSRMDALNRHRQRKICVGGADKSQTLVPHMRGQNHVNRSGGSSSSAESDMEGSASIATSDSGSVSPEPEHYQYSQPRQAIGSQQRPSVMISATHHHGQQQVAPNGSPSHGPPLVGEYQLDVKPSRPRQHRQSPHQQHLQLTSQGQSQPRSSQESLGMHLALQYGTPIPRYAVPAPLSPENEFYLNMNLISPAMTNSSQFPSEGEDQPYFY